MSSRSMRPIMSFMVRKPNSAMISRTSSAMNVKKLTTCSGCPVNRLRSLGSCVATPTGQVFRWHLRIMIQPDEISAAVAKPNSSAPKSAPMTRRDPCAGRRQLVRQCGRGAGSRPGLVRFCQSDFPEGTGVHDRSQRAGARAAVISRNSHVVCMRL